MRYPTLVTAALLMGRSLGAEPRITLAAEEPEPYAPGWRPGHLRRGRMTALAWAVVTTRKATT